MESAKKAILSLPEALIEDVADALLGEYGDEIRPLIKDLYKRAIIDLGKAISTSNTRGIEDFDEKNYLIEYSEAQAGFSNV